VKPLRLARAACALGLLALALASPASAESAEGSSAAVARASSTAGGSPAGQPADPGYRSVAPGALPPGYRKNRENGLARFEIVAFGSLPLALFYTNRGFEIYHWVKEGYDAAYAPWPVSGTSVASELAKVDTNGDGVTETNPEIFQRIAVSAGLSILVASVDAVIRLIQDNAEDRAEAERRAALPLPPPGSGGQQPLPAETGASGTPSE
jgi:hypothetical protein